MGWERVETTSDLTDRVDRRPAHARVRVGEVPEKEPDDVRELFQHDLLAALACVKKGVAALLWALLAWNPSIRARYGVAPMCVRRCACLRCYRVRVWVCAREVPICEMVIQPAWR